MRISRLLIFFFILTSAIVPPSFASGASQSDSESKASTDKPMKEEFRNLGHAFRDGTKAVGHIFKKGAKAVGKAFDGDSSDKKSQSSK